MAFTKIKFSIEDGIARIVFADPDHHNTVDLAFTKEFAEAAIRCEAAPGLRAVLLAAEGRVFSVGGDLREFMQHRARIYAQIREMTRHFHAAILSLNRLPVPVVAAVNGMAAGGGFSLVCMSDLAIAKRSARFNFAYTRSGLTPDGGASFFLSRLVGPQRAFDILATNPTLSAEQAQGLGIIARVVDDEVFETEVEQVLQALAASPANSIGRLKLLLRQGLTSSLEQQFELEAQSIATIAASAPTLATLEAFLAKSQK